MITNSPSLNLPKLLLITLYSALAGIFVKETSNPLPNRIGSYEFKKNVEKIGTKAPFSLAVYQNSKGKKVFAKIWNGNIKDFNYYTFQNEITMYKILNKVTKRVGNSIPEKLKKMYIPILIKKVQKENSLIAISEFVPGTVAKKLPTKKKLQIYLKTTEFIKFLGNQMTDKEKSLVSQRNVSHYVFLYPLLLAKAIFTHPRAAGLLVRAMPYFVRAIPALLREPVVLVHRDLHFRNILVAKNRINLIDLQYCVFTQAIYELITTLRYRWNEDGFPRLLLREIKKQYSQSPEFEVLFKGLSINSLTHGLTDNNFTKAKIDNWIDFLKFISQPKLKLEK